MGKEYRRQVTKDFSFGILIGAVTGYVDKPVVPLLLPEAVVTFSNIETALVAVPAIGNKVPATVALQVRYKF